MKKFLVVALSVVAFNAFASDTKTVAAAPAAEKTAAPAMEKKADTKTVAVAPSAEKAAAPAPAAAPAAEKAAAPAAEKTAAPAEKAPAKKHHDAKK